MVRETGNNADINVESVYRGNLRTGKGKADCKFFAVIRKISGLLLLLYMICCILYITAFVAPMFFGYEPGIVQSGSMEPSVHTGSMIYYKETDPESIRVGDIIAYQATEEVTVTHRVIEISEEDQTFRTKGDSNEAADISPVPFSRLLGRIEFTLPYGGYVYVWINQYRMALFTAGCMIVFVNSVFGLNIEKNACFFVAHMI